MSYPEKLARRVLAMKPKSPLESAKFLKTVLQDEGYHEGDPIAVELRVEVAKAAQILLRLRRAS